MPTGRLLAIAGASLLCTSAQAAPLAACRNGALELEVEGGAGRLRVRVDGPGAPERFSASVAMARLGDATRTLAVEELRGEPGRRAALPSQLFVDLFPRERRITLRHASEGDGDPAYAGDLVECELAAAGEQLVAGLVPAAKEDARCDPATVRAVWVPRVARGREASAAEVERAAGEWCERHRAAAAAHRGLERAISDAAAQRRAAARGAKVARSEDVGREAFARLDRCLSSANRAPDDEDERERACCERVAAALRAAPGR